MKTRKLRFHPLVVLLAIVFVVGALFPVYWSFNTSLKTQSEGYIMRPSLWPKSPSLDSYRLLITEKGFLHNIWNSLTVSVIVAVLSVFVSALAAYAFARLNFKGRRAMSNCILYAYLVPRSVMFIPLYILVTAMGQQNTLAGLGWIYPTFTVPYATWMLISYFRTIPVALEEAAEIDGCGRLRSIFQIVFPLSWPGIASTAIFSFTLCWSEYQYALVTITSSARKTLTLALSDMVVADVYAWGPLMAGSIIATVPVMLMYVAFSKQLVSGLTLGGVK